jgi:hypothetical protein
MLAFMAILTEPLQFLLFDTSRHCSREHQSDHTILTLAEQLVGAVTSRAKVSALDFIKISCRDDHLVSLAENLMDESIPKTRRTFSD